MINWFMFFTMEDIKNIGELVENDKRLHYTNVFCHDFLVSKSSTITLGLLEMIKIISEYKDEEKGKVMQYFNSLSSKTTKKELTNNFPYLDKDVISIIFNALNLLDSYDEEKIREEIHKSSEGIKTYLMSETLVEMKNSIKALEVAKYVLAKLNNHFSIKKLEQMLYLLQKQFLAKGYLLFSDDIEKTEEGIEIKSLREHYKISSNKPITTLLNLYKASLNIPIYYLDFLNECLDTIAGLSDEELERQVLFDEAYLISDVGVISLITMMDNLKEKSMLLHRKIV